jgi:hypothetical protein
MSLSITKSLTNCKMFTTAAVMSISAVYSYLSLDSIREALNNLSKFSKLSIKALFDLESKNITNKSLKKKLR